MSNISTRMQIFAAGAWHWVTDAWYNDGGGWTELDTLTVSGDGTLYPSGTWGSPAITPKNDIPAIPTFGYAAVDSSTGQVTWSEATSYAAANYDLVLVFSNPDHALPAYNTTVTLTKGTRTGSYTKNNAGQSGDTSTCTAHYRDPVSGTVGNDSVAACTLP